MKRILDRLMLSSLSEANDPFYLERHEIQAILYFGKGGMFSEDIKLYHRDALPDGSLSPGMLEDGIEFLRHSLAAGRRVLAVGTSGATIVAAYLAEMGMSHQQSVELIRSAEDVPLPDAHQLQEHESRLIKKSQVTVGH